MVPEDQAVAEVDALGSVPLEPFPGRARSWRLRCTRCGQDDEWVLAALRAGTNVPCRRCDAGGSERHDPDAMTGVYVITHPRLGAHKVGVGLRSRLRSHEAEGWQTHGVLPMPRAEAERVGRAVLRQLRAAGFGPYLPSELMPQGGWTETVDAAGIMVPALWRMVLDSAPPAARRGRAGSIPACLG